MGNKCMKMMDGMSKRVYRLVSMVPEGRVCTYADIARALGKPRACRVIGKILNRNPNPLIVPCHRVVRSDGRVGGYMYGYEAKKRLLESEGIRIDGEGRIIGFESVRLRFADLGDTPTAEVMGFSRLVEALRTQPHLRVWGYHVHALPSHTSH